MNNKDQQLFDLACQAVGGHLWVEHNQRLAKLAVKETGLGNVSDKIKKNHNKTLGLLRDIGEIFWTCLRRRRIGFECVLELKVVVAIVPSQPLATPVNNIINALKCGNSINPIAKGSTAI